jgi:predicted RNase H-like HicB family nuclease
LRGESLLAEQQVKHVGAVTRDIALDSALVLEADSDGGYVAKFRDLPVCLTQGKTLAMAMATDASRGRIEATDEVGKDIPRPALTSV